MVLEKSAAACRLFALSLGVLILHGCAVLEPGFDYADPQQRSSISRADANNPPQGVVVPITAELVQSQRQETPREVPPQVAKLFATPGPYTIGVSDIVAVIVYDHPELLPLGTQVISLQPDPTGISSAPGFIVDGDGSIAYPYAGRMKIAGLTEAQAGELIA